MKVLLIGAEPRTEKMVVLSLRLHWPDTQAVVASGGTKGIDLLVRECPDLIILDSHLTAVSPSDVIRRIRGVSDLPLIVLGAEQDDSEAIAALEAGADDYIPRPYEFVEVVARVMALLRRLPGDKSSNIDIEAPISHGPLVINPATHEVFLDRCRLALTYTEFKLLHLLVKNRGMIAPYRVLSRAIWGDRVDSSPLVKKYIQRLRNKLGDNPRNPRWIANVHGIGYRFIGPPKEVSEGAGLGTSGGSQHPLRRSVSHSATSSHTS